MLSAAHRLRRSQDFQYVIRRGVRVGRPSVVVHAAPRGPRDTVDGGARDTVGRPAGPSESAARVGFVVSKAVGNAVVRNRVKRRLRALVRETLESPIAGTVGNDDTDWVIRALPPAAVGDQLESEFHAAWRGCQKRLAR